MNRSERLNNIEVFRGLAALAVTWFHLTNTYDPGPAALSGSLGWLGVEVFFVITGFVIPYSLVQNGYRLPQFPRFLARRFVRLEPPYIASIVLVIALAFLSSAAPGFQGAVPEFSIGQLLSHLLYFVPLTSFDWINVVYWSLAYEFAFYLAAGLLFPLLWSKHVLFTIAATAVCLFAKFLLAGAFDGRILLFLYGVSAARYFVGRDGAVESIVTCALVTSALIFIQHGDYAIIGLATALSIVFIKLPKWRPLEMLGAISYSLYLTHVPVGGRVVNLGKRFIEGPAQELMLSILALVVSIIFAALFYVVIEKAATRLSKRITLAGKSPTR